MGNAVLQGIIYLAVLYRRVSHVGQVEDALTKGQTTPCILTGINEKGYSK